MSETQKATIRTVGAVVSALVGFSGGALLTIALLAPLSVEVALVAAVGSIALALGMYGMCKLS